ncbi:MAG: permease [Pseudomonadota bacterium]
MTARPLAPTAVRDPIGRLFAATRGQRVWLLSATILAALFVLVPEQGVRSVLFTLTAHLQTAPFLVASIALAAAATATGADNLVAAAFRGAPGRMIVLAALAGALSPFCSCGVIPLVAALLAMGVPLSAVMAFWLASPVMDPSMFALTAGVLGFEFAVVKTLAAVAIGLGGGALTLLLERKGRLTDPLREGIGNGGCGGAKMRAPKPVVWAFWREPARLQKFRAESVSVTLFLAKWLTFAFLLESLMVAYVPGELVAKTLGGDGALSILIATLVGVPAYLNGYAAAPLVAGLVDQGMGAGAALAFLVAGGISSLPAAIAVWALARPPVFILYLAFALTGSFLVGVIYQMVA